MRFTRRTDRWEREIERLDPVRDAHAIVEVLTSHVFPLDILIASELGQLRTFTIPTISKVLHATRQYETEGVKRLDDTKALLSEILRAGAGSPEAEPLIDHLHAIHAHYDISNDDYLYTLSVFVIDPSEWIDRYGFRPMRDREREAVMNVFRDLGTKMGIADVPATFDDFRAWRRAYEEHAQRPSDDNHAVARGFLRAAESMVPALCRPWVAPISLALFDEPRVVAALGFSPTGKVVRTFVDAVMAARRWLLRRVNPWETASFSDSELANRYVTYPDGYHPLRLGPTKVVASIDRKRAAGCPLHRARP
jgi:hypothetical protein